MKNYRGPKSSGMGDVLYTTGSYSEALFGNPARHSMTEQTKIIPADFLFESNIGFISNGGEFSRARNQSGSAILGDAAGMFGQNLHFRSQNLSGYFHPNLFYDLGFAFGILTSLHSNTWTHYTTNIETQTALDVGPALGVSYPFFNRSLFLGINLRMLYRVGSETPLSKADYLSFGKRLNISSLGNQGIGFDGDVGSFYYLPWQASFMRFGIGATITNFMASSYTFLDAPVLNSVSGIFPPANERTYNFGLRLDVANFWFLDSPLFALEFQDLGTNRAFSVFKYVHFGSEFHFFNKYLVFRWGLNQGYWTAGFGVDLPILHIDIATYGEELSSHAGSFQDRRFLFRLAYEL